MTDADTDGHLLPETEVADLAAYVAGGGGQGLTAALAASPEEVTNLVDRSGLRGRGGGGFRTGTKWRSIAGTAQAEDLAVAVVCNAAEGEPGTYKDRALLTLDPYQVVEGLLIACYAVGARTAYIGLKGSFTRQRERLTTALAEAAAAGWPSADAIAIVDGPDEYLFGEETAMMEVIEGNLPMPRHLAPYINGLFTNSATPSLALVNNVETLANVPLILRDGPDALRRSGTEDSPGTMLFTVTGDVGSPGVYELPLGTPLDTLLEIADAGEIKFVVSGVSNTVVTPAMLTTPLDYESMASVGTGLASGGFVVYDAGHCIVRVAAVLARFLAVESCGQCNACQLGTRSITDLLERIDRGEGTRLDLEQLARQAASVTDLARCALPTGAQLLVASLLQDFEDELIDHLGAPCWSTREALLPKIVDFDLETGQVVFDTDYHRKRDDWSYAPPAD